jgi:hypothetical protein
LSNKDELTLIGKIFDRKEVMVEELVKIMLECDHKIQPPKWRWIGLREKIGETFME